MAGTYSNGQEDKRPSRIHSYPANGERVHLFSKPISSTDFTKGLRLTGFATTYLEDLPPQFCSEIRENGFRVTCYTPAANFYNIMLEYSKPKDSPVYRLSRNWQEFASANGWDEYHRIDCWGVFDPFTGMLCFLLE